MDHPSPGGNVNEPGERDFFSPERTIFHLESWIALFLLARNLFGPPWPVPGDFDFRTAMDYHGVMVPLLVLFYLLAAEILSLKPPGGRVFTAGALLSGLLAGLGALLQGGLPAPIPAVLLVAGMIGADLLGIALFLVLVLFGLRKRERIRGRAAPFLLILFALAAVLAAAPLGHLAGWMKDAGPPSIPGLSSFLQARGIDPGDFREGLVGSHSHLVAAALLAGLGGLAAFFYSGPSKHAWKASLRRRASAVLALLLLLAAVLYMVSALFTWEPPTLFASGPNGIPLDDVLLAGASLCLLLLASGLTRPPANEPGGPPAPASRSIPLLLGLNWTCLFAGSVALGIWIEFHEGFYGGGDPPAAGALRDQVFIRAHLLFPYMLLPTLAAFLLAAGSRARSRRRASPWTWIFLALAAAGMGLGLAGEFHWFSTGEKELFQAGLLVMEGALAAGALSLIPRRKPALD